ncbi:uncharacterized protein PSFLO_01677 [Pseudozyma flocculosa]|uniref:Uncharacterized protein n=1 Tax=Pseudozyma flocculosa TaxID=84751 RepID=A0A5C3EX78_9BASI|nr:uncharacterized protein PSFLO_01677 [Pseudozyma flocculosa]
MGKSRAGRVVRPTARTCLGSIPFSAPPSSKGQMESSGPWRLGRSVGQSCRDDGWRWLRYPSKRPGQARPLRRGDACENERVWLGMDLLLLCLDCPSVDGQNIHLPEAQRIDVRNYVLQSNLSRGPQALPAAACCIKTAAKGLPCHIRLAIVSFIVVDRPAVAPVVVVRPGQAEPVEAWHGVADALRSPAPSLRSSTDATLA